MVDSPKAVPMARDGDMRSTLRPGTTRQLVAIALMTLAALGIVALGSVLLGYNVSTHKGVGIAGSVIVLAFGLFLLSMSVAGLVIRKRYREGRYRDEYESTDGFLSNDELLDQIRRQPQK